MKVVNYVAVLIVLATWQAQGQGAFVFGTPTAARTRIGSISGPLAGPEIWAHMLVGLTITDLSPLGPDQPHIIDGAIFGGILIVPDAPPHTYVYTQMVAWDSRLWGTALEGVPLDQLGRTDVARVFLDFAEGPPGLPVVPDFSIPAIVPVPEPAGLALWPLAGIALTCWLRIQKRACHR